VYVPGNRRLKGVPSRDNHKREIPETVELSLFRIGEKIQDGR
jgi:hypothetical protein